MYKFIRSVLNYENILSSYISAIGYGIGYSFPNFFGVNPFICLIVSLLLGFPFDYLAEKALSNKLFTGSRKRRRIFAIIVYVIYFIAWYYVNKYLIYDLDEDFFTNILLIFIFQLIALIMHYVNKYLKKFMNDKK